MWPRSATPRHLEDLACSFCRKSQSEVGKLISSPSDYPRAYICNECIRVCNDILDDPPDIRFLHDPSAADFLTVVERWITCESRGEDASDDLAEMRAMAKRMLDTAADAQPLS